MKNRIFVIVVCIAFLAVMGGMVYAKMSSAGTDSSGIILAAVAEPDEICEPMSQGFWKRLCKDNGRSKKHPASTLFDLSVVEGYEDLCEALLEKTKDDPCLRADAQLAALEFNLEFGILTEGCEGFDDGGAPTTVGEVLDEIESLLGGVPETCKEIGELAEDINSRDFFEDPYYVANLFNVEQNTFYKDLYAKISNWLNDFLNI